MNAGLFYASESELFPFPLFLPITFHSPDSFWMHPLEIHQQTPLAQIHSLFTAGELD